ncbi:unnamed protein product [Tenebrio molitor]|nr:unnamed protein product [Tenebrio molitor]
MPGLPDKVWFLEFRQNLFIIAVQYGNKPLAKNMTTK